MVRCELGKGGFVGLVCGFWLMLTVIRRDVSYQRTRLATPPRVRLAENALR